MRATPLTGFYENELSADRGPAYLSFHPLPYLSGIGTISIDYDMFMGSFQYLTFYLATQIVFRYWLIRIRSNRNATRPLFSATGENEYGISSMKIMIGLAKYRSH